MKIFIILLSVVFSFRSFANLTYQASAIIDQGDVVEVIHPKLYGMIGRWAYGGMSNFELHPSHSGNKICKGLGFKNYLKGTKSILKTDGDFYTFMGNEILDRHGVGGQSWSKNIKYIASLKCVRSRSL